jgi:hypothetical protein
MNALTAERCEEMIAEMESLRARGYPISTYWMDALRNLAAGIRMVENVIHSKADIHYSDVHQLHNALRGIGP